jgi:hypothetical protein
VAAAAYQDLSAVTAAHFDAAVERSLLVSSALAGYANELDGCQQDGKVAAREAVRCLEEIGTLRAKVAAARQAAAEAESGLSSARSRASAARASGPLAIAAAAAAEVDAAASATALGVAQADEKAASVALTAAEDELAVWRARGRRAWEEAEAAAQRAIRQLEQIKIAPPPLAGTAGIAPLTATPPFAPSGPLINPGGPSLGGILGFTASPLPRSTILPGRAQPKQLSPEEEAAVQAKQAKEYYDPKVYKAAEKKLKYNEKVVARTRNQQKRQSRLRQPPKGKK